MQYRKPSTQPTETAPGHRFLQAFPILDLIAAWQNQLDTMRLLAPQSDLCRLLTQMCDDARLAVERAGRGDMYMTVEAFAGFFGMKEIAVTHLCRAGKLPAHKAGRRWLIDLDQYEKGIATPRAEAA